MLNTRLTTGIYYSPEFSISGGMADITKPITRSLGWYLGFREPSYTLTSDEEYLTYRLGVSRYKCYLTGEVDIRKQRG
jgi:hypothetical protein